MSDPLIQEFEDADKQEKAAALWSEYGGYLIASALLAVLFTGLITAYKNYQHSVDQNQTLALVASLEADDRALTLSETAFELDGGIRAIAVLSAAGAYLSEDKPAEALAQYEKAAADKKMPENFRDLAEFMAVRLKWDLASAESIDADVLPDEYIQRLKPLIAKNNSPWQAHAHIQAALIMAAQNDYKAALNYVNSALDIKQIPPSLQERARALQHIYVLEVGQLPPQKNTAEQEAQG